MRKNRVFTAFFQFDVASGATQAVTWNVNNFNRSFLFKSVFYDLRLRTTLAPFVNLPLEQNTTQNYSLYILPPVVPFLFAQNIDNVAPAVALIGNGNEIVLSRNVQLKFDSFYIRDSLLFAFNTINNDALVQYRYYLSFVCEIEDSEVIK